MGDADVERVRRAHLNDLENIIPFTILVIILHNLTHACWGRDPSAKLSAPNQPFLGRRNFESIIYYKVAT